MQEEVVLSKVAHEYIDELELSRSRYPLSTYFIKKFNELVVCTEIEEFGVKKFLTEQSEIAYSMLGIQTPVMLYASERQKEDCQVIIKNGLLYFSNGVLVDSENMFKSFFNGRTPREDDLFLQNSGYTMHEHRIGKSEASCIILDRDDNVFIFPYRAETIHHTFINHGDVVRFAGMIKVKNGKIEMISDSSGHYRTPDQSTIIYVADFFARNIRNPSELFVENFSIQNISLFKKPEVSELVRNEIKRKFLVKCNLVTKTPTVFK